MRSEDFDALVNRARAAKPGLFELEATLEPVASDTPAAFQYFLHKYGWGEFGYVRVVAPSLVGPDFLACGEDGAGGYYGFVRSEGQFGDAVYYWYPSEADPARRTYDSFFDFVADLGLRGPGLPEQVASQ